MATSRDFGASIDSDALLYSFTPLSLLEATGDPNADREFGDFLFLTSLGDTFYGTFAGLGDVAGGGINTTGLIDPFFFTGRDIAVPEPGSLSVLAAAFSGSILLSRRKRCGSR